MAIYRQPCSVNNESGADKFDEFLVIRDTTRRTLSPVRSSCVDGTNGAVCKCWVGHNNRRVNRASTTPSGTRSHPVRRTTNAYMRLTYTSLYVLIEYVQRGLSAMPRVAVEDNSRMSLRIRPEEKALLLRAVALNHTDLTDFVIRHALRAAKAVIEEADHVQLSARDSLRVLDLLENPPAPNARLRAAARALPRRS